MKEHPIPQDITGYKFHIVGNMTLKQFLEVAIGVVIAFFIQKTNLVGFVKWPLIFLSGGLGAALAFLPIEERPLDHWFATFFTTLYKPTKFFWKKEPKIPEVFLYKQNLLTKKQEEVLDLSPQRRQRMSDFLESVKTPQSLNPEDLMAKQRSAQLLSIFKDQTLKVDFSTTKKLSKKPNLKVRARSLVGVEEKITPEPEPVVVFENPQNQAGFAPQPTAVFDTNAPLAKKPVDSSQVATEIEIPELIKIEVEKTAKKAAAEITQKIQSPGDQQVIFSSTQQSSPERSAVTATQSLDLPFPSKPTEANKIVGMVLTKNNELINGATITISDENRRLTTAVKTNALGQFFISSKLGNGNYIIDVKKDNFTFQSIKITLNGSVINPLEVRSDQ